VIPRCTWSLLLLATLYTGINAFTPLRIDDAYGVQMAHHLAHAPFDPYGFAGYWYDVPQRANEILLTPVLPGYVALCQSLSGERPWVWKLMLWPWALGLVFSLASLLRRFAPGCERAGAVLLVFSPALWPSFQLMLDVPTLALTLASIALFLHALERSSFALATAAGLLAGLAMQTKYTGGAAPLVIGLACLVRPGQTGALFPSLRQLLLGGAAWLGAFQVFLGWELLIALLYGRSHFLLALAGRSDFFQRLGQLEFLFVYLGGLGAFALLFGLVGLGLSRWVLAGASGVVVLGYGLIGFQDARFVNTLGPGKPITFHLAEVIFLVFGLAGAGVILWALWHLYKREEAGARRATLFLGLWLVLEAALYIPLAPFPAARRVLGPFVVGGLILARLLSRTSLAPRPHPFLWPLGLGSLAVAVCFLLVDWHDALVHQRAAEQAYQWIQARRGGRTWYVGHWGFQYYAERLGMTPVIPAYYRPADDGPGQPIPLPAPSRLQPGDWLVVPDPRLEQPWIQLDPEFLDRKHQLTFAGGLPVTTMSCYYGGRTPLAYHRGTNLEVRIYRVRQAFVPRRSTSEEARQAW
jgi:hypothetical protein